MKFLLKSTDVGPYYESIQKEYPQFFRKFSISNENDWAIVEINDLEDILIMLGETREIIIGEMDSYDKKTYGDYDAFIEIYDKRRE